MGRAMKPTLRQKKFLTAAGLEARDYLILDDVGDVLIVVHKTDGRRRVVQKTNTALPDGRKRK